MSELSNTENTNSHNEGVSADKADLHSKVVEVLKSCFDPEIPVNIWELGLIYGIIIDDDNNVEIVMTLTSPACPVAGSLPPDIERKVRNVKGVKNVKANVVWEPMWGPHLMSEAAKLQLGFF